MRTFINSFSYANYTWKIGIKPKIRKSAEHLVCNVIDKTKFQYTLSTKDTTGKIINTDRIVQDFNHYFNTITGITTRDQVLAVVNSSKEAREWYVEWQKANALEATDPGFLDLTKDEERKEWENAFNKLQAFKKKNAERQKAIEVKAKELKDLVTATEKQNREDVLTLPVYAQIALVNPSTLPTEEASKLALATTQEAKNLIVLNYQKKLLLTKNNWKSPFA